MRLRYTDAELRVLQYSWIERRFCDIGLHDWRHTGLLPSSDPFVAGDECRRCGVFKGTMLRPTKKEVVK